MGKKKDKKKAKKAIREQKEDNAAGAGIRLRVTGDVVDAKAGDISEEELKSIRRRWETVLQEGPFTVATKYHDFCMGHTVYQHEGKCQHLHGHNYRVHFSVCARTLDRVGRVLDFGVISELLCNWLEENWDHKFLVFHEDPRSSALKGIDDTVVIAPFNPTAENIAQYLLRCVGPKVLAPLEGVMLWKVVVEETRKCSAMAVEVVHDWLKEQK